MDFLFFPVYLSWGLTSNSDLFIMNLHYKVHIFIIKIWEKNDSLFNRITIFNKRNCDFHTPDR